MGGTYVILRKLTLTSSTCTLVPHRHNSDIKADPR